MLSILELTLTWRRGISKDLYIRFEKREKVDKIYSYKLRPVWNACVTNIYIITYTRTKSIRSKSDKKLKKRRLLHSL